MVLPISSALLFGISLISLSLSLSLSVSVSVSLSLSLRKLKLNVNGSFPRFVSGFVFVSIYV